MPTVIQKDDRTGEIIALDVNDDGCVQEEIARDADYKEVMNVVGKPEGEVRNDVGKEDIVDEPVDESADEVVDPEAEVVGKPVGRTAKKGTSNA